MKQPQTLDVFEQPELAHSRIGDLRTVEQQELQSRELADLVKTGVRDRHASQFQELDVRQLAERLQAGIRHLSVAQTKFREVFEPGQVLQAGVGHRHPAKVDPAQMREFAEPFQSGIAQTGLVQGEVEVGELCECLQFADALDPSAASRKDRVLFSFVISASLWNPAGVTLVSARLSSLK